MGDATNRGRGRRFAIVVGRFNEVVTSRLLQGAMETLTAAGVGGDDIATFWVPGAFEIPLACQWAAATGRFDAILALGAVIRGGTSHYEHVCNQAARGVLDVGLEASLPIAFGVLTCDTLELALARAGKGDDNKGTEAARAALDMLAVKAAMGSGADRG